jgi:hypothetical protein
LHHGICALSYLSSCLQIVGIFYPCANSFNSILLSFADMFSGSKSSLLIIMITEQRDEATSAAEIQSTKRYVPVRIDHRSLTSSQNTRYLTSKPRTKYQWIRDKVSEFNIYFLSWAWNHFLQIFINIEFGIVHIRYL